MADVAAMEDLGLIPLSHGHAAVPSDLGRIICEPDDLKPEGLAEFSHGLLHVGVGQARAERATLDTRRSAARIQCPHSEGNIWTFAIHEFGRVPRVLDLPCR